MAQHKMKIRSQTSRFLACLSLSITVTSSGAYAFAPAVRNSVQHENNKTQPYIWASSSSLQDSWQEFSPEREEFTVSLPQAPRVTQGKRFFGDRPRDYKFRFYIVVAGNTLFMVESYEGDKPKDLARILMSGRRAITDQASIELNGFKGKEFSHSVEGLSFKGRYFATSKHLYVVEAAKRGAYDPTMDQFLNSFRFESKNVPASSDVGLAASSSGGVFEMQKVTKKAIILSKLPATYTDSARNHMIRGTVVLEAVLRASGEVSDIKVRAGLPEGLSEISIEATKAIVFVPAEKDGKPVSQKVVVEYNFNIY